MLNAIRHVDANVLAKDSLERFGYDVAIVRMQSSQPFGECRNAFRWIETEENECLRRPIIEYSIRLQRPASHVCESLTLPQIKFACFQFLRSIFLLVYIKFIPVQPHNFSILKH